MPTEIDSLQIQVTASAQKANDAIDRLVVKLDRLSTSLGGLKTGNLNGLANGVDRLGRAMQTMNTVKTTDFTRLATNLAKLGNMNVSALNSTASSLSHLTRAFNTLGGVSFDNKNLQNLINSITRLSNSNVQNLANIDFSRLGISINQLATSLSNAPKIQQSVISMTNAIANLSKSGQNIPIVASSLGSLGQSMNTFMASVSSAPNVSDNVISFAQAIGLLANSGKNAGVTAKNLLSLGVGLRDLMETLSKAPLVSQSVIQMTNALARLSAQGARVGSASRSIERGLNRASTSAERARKSYGGLASAIGKFYATYFLVIRAIKGLGKAITSTADYVEAFNYFTVSMGKIASKWDEDWENYGDENARNYSNSFVTTMNDTFRKLSGVSFDPKTGLLSETGLKNLGLNLQEVTQYAAQLASMMDAVGQSGETTLATTNAFVKLAGDISSLYNIDYQDAANKIRSVLQGQSRAGYSFGWDTTMAALQSTADRLDLSKPVSEMAQWEKQQLRILTILEQSRVAWGDQSNTINTLANQMRIFKNNISEVGMTLGQLFVPILQKVMPVVNGVTIAIKRLMTNIAGFLGIKIEDTGQGYTQIEDEFDGIEDSVDGATEAIDKFKSHTLGIDELNIASPDTSGADTSGLDNTIDLTKEIIAATEDYEKVWASAFEQMENKAEAIADVFSNMLKPIENIFSDIAGGEWIKLGEDVSGLASSIMKFFTNAIRSVDWNSVGNAIGDFISGIDFGKVIINFIGLADAMLDGIAQAISGIVNKAPIESAIVGLFLALNYTGVISAIGQSIGNLLAIRGITFGNIAVGIGLGAISWRLLDEEGVWAKISGVITSGLASFILTKNPYIAIGTIAVTGVIAFTSHLIDKYSNNKIFNLYEDLLNEDGLSLSDYVDDFNEDIKNATIDTNQIEIDLKNIAQAKGDILGTKENIDNLFLAISNGTGDTKTNVDTLIGEFKRLLISTKSLLESQTQVVTGALANVSEDVFSAYGTTRDAALGEMTGLSGNILNKYETDLLRLEELREMMSRPLSAEGYKQVLSEFTEIQNRLDILTNSSRSAYEEAKKSISEYGINIGELLTENNEVDNKKVEEQLGKLVSGYEEAKNTINEYYKEVLSAKDELARQAQALGISASDYEEILLAQKEIDIESIAKSYADVVKELEQSFLQQAFGGIAEMSSNMAEFEGYFIDAGTLVENMQKSIDKALKNSDLKIDFNMMEATEKMVILPDEIFDVDEINKVISNAMEGAGYDALKGYDNGLRKGSEEPKKSIITFGNDFIKTFHDGPLKFGSPSKTMEQFGIDTMKGFGNGLIKGFNTIYGTIVSVSSAIRSAFGDYNMAINLPTRMPIPQYEVGGFPEDGLFFANHNELVGQFSNGKTAVANNGQIVDGIKEGVKEAVAEILAPYLSDIARNTRETADKDMSVNIGDREIARANARGQRSLGYQLIT